MKNNLNTEKDEQRNLLLALLLVMIILFGVNTLSPDTRKNTLTGPTNVPVVVTQTQNANIPSEKVINANFPSKSVQKLSVLNDFIKASFNASSGGLDALSLLKYKETIKKESQTVSLLSSDYFTALAWKSHDARMPDEQSKWQVSSDIITSQTPVSLVFQNEDVRIERTVSLDNAYMLTVSDKVVNLRNVPITLTQTGKIIREVDKMPGASTVHEGFFGFVDNKLIEKKYNAVEDDIYSARTRGGWLGMTDKYWQTVLIFDPNETVTVRFDSAKNGVYVASFETEDFVIAPGQEITRVNRTFSGAKDIDLINTYQDNLNIPRFDLSIDFGWFYFLTKPFLYFLNWLYSLLGNMGVAILVFATLIRIALLPIATKSYESMAKMRKIQPKMVALQARFKNDRQRLQIETMNLYKREKVNPAAGCLPMFLQIPVFFALYKVLSVSINMRQAPFFGWIHDLSLPDPSSVFTAFGYLDWPIPSLLNLGVWPILMGLTMYIQQKLSPAPADQTQARVMRFLPIIFTFMLGGFAAGLVIYWTWSNVLSILQQKYIMKKIGVK